MLITLNGEKREISFSTSSLTLKKLIEENGLEPGKIEKVAAEVNGQIIEREKFNDMTIKAGDKVELIHFLGGG